jgi:hypothetical protein
MSIQKKSILNGAFNGQQSAISQHLLAVLATIYCQLFLHPVKEPDTNGISFHVLVSTCIG